MRGHEKVLLEQQLEWETISGLGAMVVVVEQNLDCSSHTLIPKP